MTVTGERWGWRAGAAALAALAAWAGLALQFGLTVERMTAEGASVGAAVWRFFGFFTILINLAVAIVATAMAFAPDGRLAGDRARLATATAIAFVGLVYSALLRATWSPTGWQAAADHTLHDATPLLFLIVWALSGHGGLKWRDAAWGLVPALAYCAYAFARGAVDGWYAYWFMDPTRLGLARMAVNIGLLSAALLALALVLVAVDRWLGRRAAGRS